MGKDTEVLQERIEKLEKQMRRIEEEWTEVYSKFRTLQMRTAKQVQRLEEDSPPEAPEAKGEDANGGGLPTATSLSPRAQLIQKQILERRRLMGKAGE